MQNFLYLVRFSHSMKSVFFQYHDNALKIGDNVVCNTAKGIELGEITRGPIVSKNDEKDLIETIARPATSEDVFNNQKNLDLAQEAEKIFKEEVERLGLQMQLISAYYTLNREKLIFSYLATERVDFRELLRILARDFRTRIDLRQVTTRDRAQFVGGIGMCGLPLCCTTFLQDFEGITVQKAKNQMLTINSAKINGQCGKLLCCLKFEDDVYTMERKEFPALGFTFKIEDKEYKVIGFNVISRDVKLGGPDGIETRPLEEIIPHFNKNEPKKKFFKSKK